MLVPAYSYQRSLPAMYVCYFRWRAGVTPSSVILAVCVVIMNILCCWFRFLKERGGSVLLSGVQFVYCFQYGVICIEVCYLRCMYSVVYHN
jgi:hypothetical protein